MTDRNYTTSAKISAFLGKTITESLTDYILAAQKYIEDYTGRIFKADSTASTRLFNGNGKCEIFVDECIQITKVETGNDSYGETFTEVASSGADRYFIKPDNYDKHDPKLPITSIIVNARYFLEGIQNQRITAKWGSYVAAPEDVSFAATVIASGMYNSNKGGSGKKSESIGNYSVTYTEGNWADFDRAKTILNNYKKMYL